MTQITVNGNTYSDDGTSSKDLQNGGHRNYLLPMISDTVADTAAKVAAAGTQASNAANSASAAASSAATAANAPGTNAASTTSLTIGIGTQSLTIQSGKLLVPGMPVVIANTASPTNYMAGTVTSYNSGTGQLVVNVTNISGSGAAAAWTVSLTGVPGVTGVLNELKAANIASAATVNLDAATGNLVHITGTTGITAFTLASGSRRTVVFDGVLTITNSANVQCPAGQNITTEAGDMCTIYGDGAGVVLLTDYIRKSGLANMVSGIVRSPRTANAILGIADIGKLIDITSGTFTQTFAAASVLGNGWFCYVRNSGTGTITLKPNGSETINGATTLLLAQNAPVLIQGDGSNFYTASNTLNSQYMSVRDQRASGSGVGSVPADITQTRVLNTVSANNIPGASLASNQITLPAGTYKISAKCPSSADNHKAFLYNVTDAIYVIVGSSEFASISALGCTSSFINGQFTISASKTFSIRHYTSSANSYGLGYPVGSGQIEVYTEVEIWKVG